MSGPGAVGPSPFEARREHLRVTVMD